MVNIIVGSIILIILSIAGYKVYKGNKHSSCGCGCTGCSNRNHCTQN